MNTWTQQEAIELCVAIERIAPRFGCHVALSGGCLYKTGKRKDCDLILYRIRQSPVIRFDDLFEEMRKIGVEKISGFGFCHKAIFKGKKIDFLSPEEEGDEYGIDELDVVDKQGLFQ